MPWLIVGTCTSSCCQYSNAVLLLWFVFLLVFTVTVTVSNCTTTKHVQCSAVHKPSNATDRPTDWPHRCHQKMNGSERMAKVDMMCVCKRAYCTSVRICVWTVATIPTVLYCSTVLVYSTRLYRNDSKLLQDPRFLMISESPGYHITKPLYSVHST